MKLNLGCGYKHLDGYVNIDSDPSVRPDLIFNFDNPLPYFDDSVDEILCEQVLEHLSNYKNFIFDIHRVLKPEGLVTFSVPQFPCIAAIADPDHKHFFVMENFMHFGNPLWFQPSNFSGKGLFDLVDGVVIKWKDKGEMNGEAGRYFTELRITMKKVDHEYWKGRGNIAFKYNVEIRNRGE
jgi:SAM-dependent methyltransferase